MRAEIAVFLLNLSETFLRTAPHRRTWKLLRVTTKLQVAEGLNVTCALFNHSCVVVIINAYSTTHALRHYKAVYHTQVRCQFHLHQVNRTIQMKWRVVNSGIVFKYCQKHMKW